MNISDNTVMQNIVKNVQEDLIENAENPEISSDINSSNHDDLSQAVLLSAIKPKVKNQARIITDPIYKENLIESQQVKRVKLKKEPIDKLPKKKKVNLKIISNVQVKPAKTKVSRKKKAENQDCLPVIKKLQVLPSTGMIDQQPTGAMEVSQNHSLTFTPHKEASQVYMQPILIADHNHNYQDLQNVCVPHSPIHSTSEIDNNQKIQAQPIFITSTPKKQVLVNSQVYNQPRVIADSKRTYQDLDIQNIPIMLAMDQSFNGK